MPSKTWLTPRDVTDALSARWRRGAFLADLMAVRPATPLGVPLRGPGAREVADRFADVQNWVQTWERASTAKEYGYRLEYAAVGGRLVGNNRVPVRAWVDDQDHLWRLLGVAHHVASLQRLLAETVGSYPQLENWIRDHPAHALASADHWSQALAVVAWIVQNGGPTVHVRQIDVPGVDTKFVEAHRQLLADLLDAVLPAERIDLAVPRTRFASRYGLAAKPAYVRLRRLDGRPLYPGWPGARNGRGPAELTLRTPDLADNPAPAGRVVIVENELTYLALPELPDTIAVLGSGYGLTRLGPVEWLGEREIHYWGDLDTHGFVILDQLRSVLPHARSLLMDRATLEQHRDHWGSEPTPENTTLTRLTEPEQALYRDLVEDRYAPSVRLEQERIRFGVVAAALGGI